jgi:hypothetical protein
VEYYGKVANFPEIIREAVLVDILKVKKDLQN